MEADLLLVGGGVASARCARTLRREGFDGSILLIGDEHVPPYNRPPLSKAILHSSAPEQLLAAEPDGWYARHGVELLTESTVTRIHLDTRRASLADGRTAHFGRCLLATGAAPRPLTVPGGERALVLRTLDDARALRAAVAATEPGAPVAVVGGGLIGVEVASALASMGLRPTIVELGPSLWGGAAGTLLAEWGHTKLSQAGVALRLNSTVTALETEGVRLGDERLPAAFVVAGIGVRPRAELAEGAGLAVDRGIIVGADGRTSHPAVWAAGDVARVDGIANEHWHAARESGHRAALSMLGMAPPQIQPPWTFTEVAGRPVDLFGSAFPSDEELWAAEGRVIARMRADRVSQLVSIDGALRAEEARRLVADGMRRDDLRDLARSLRG